MKKDYIMWGATGQAYVLEELLGNKEYNLIATFDETKGAKFHDEKIPTYYGKEVFEKWYEDWDKKKDLYFIVAIGGDTLGKVRVKLHEYLKEMGLKPLTAIHSMGFTAKDAEIGEGCQLLANHSVCVGSKLEKSVIINTGAQVDHECTISEGVHIAPGAVLCGNVKVGEYSFIGAGSTILPRLKIGKNVVIGAGSVVTKDIPDNAIAYGNPAKIKEKK